MEFVVNEVKHVENLLKNKKVTPRKVMKELRLIVQYYLSKGCTKEETVELTVQFMNDVNGNSSGEKWRKRIESTTNDIISKQDYELRDIEEIHITNSELEAIKSLNNDKLRRYAFGLLIRCKIINYKKHGQWVILDNTSVFLKEINVTAGGEKREKLFHELQTLGFIEITRMTGGSSIKLHYVNYLEEPVVTIPLKDINEYITYYEELVSNATIYHCLNCGVRCSWIPKKGRRPNYCRSCDKERTKKRVQKSRGTKEV